MNDQASTDHGTVLRKDQAALIVNEDGSFGLLLPTAADDAPVSLGQKLLVAIAVRLDDPEWVEDMLAALDAAHRSLSRH
jgi:hypothetical protein